MSHMLSEIKEQPTIWQELMNNPVPALSRSAKYIVSGHGTSYNAALFAETVGRLNSYDVTAVVPYELKNISSETILILISQSGQTEDLLYVAGHHQGKIVCITNNADSDLAAISDQVCILQAGEERAVAATKTFTTSLMLAAQLFDFPCIMANISHDHLDHKAQVCAQEILSARSVCAGAEPLCLFLAQELALKLQETSYLPAFTGEFEMLLHGPVASISKDTLLITASTHESQQKRAFAKAAKTRGQFMQIDLDIDTNNFLGSVLQVAYQMQLVVYYLSVLNGINPDQPYGLSKVTKVG